MFRSMFTVGGFTLMSRLLGFVRDIAIASHLGAGALGDVWVAAFRLPNLFRRIFGEGAFNSAFVPMYSRRLEEGGDEVADLFARRVISVMSVILIVLFILCFIFMEPVVKVMNWGFAEDGRLEPAVNASRVTIVYLIFICLVAAFSAILNSRRIFGAPAFAYVVLNIIFIFSLFVIIPRTGEPLKVLTWSVVVAGVCQLAVVVGACIRRGIKIAPRLPVIDDDIKRLGILMAPGLLSAGIQQINLVIGQTVASLQLGGQSLIYFSDRINQLPLGLIGMAAGVVLLPEISRSLRAGESGAAQASMAKGMEISMLLCLPAMVAMLVIPREIMFAIFEGGKFSTRDAIDSGWVLCAFAVGTPAYVLAKVLQPGYFAHENTKTPMKFTIASAVVNIILCWPLFKAFGVAGCALATTVAGWVNVGLLWFGLRGMDFLGLPKGFFSRMGRMLLSASIMGLAVWGLSQYLSEWIFAEGQRVLRLSVVGGLVAIGVIVYFALIFATRVFTVGELKKTLRRGGKA